MSSTMSPCCCGAWTCPEACLSQLWRGDALQQQRLLQVEANRADMDLTSLREQYKRTQEKQKRHTQVVLLRRASTELCDSLSDSLSVVPVTQDLSQQQEQNNDPSTSGSLVFDPAMTTCDPWHTHLGLYRRACLLTAGVAVKPSHPPTTDAHLNNQHWPRPPRSRWSSSLSEAAEQEVLNTLTTDTSQKSSSEVSPSSSPNRTRGDGPVWSFNRSEIVDNHRSPGELSGDEAKEDDVSNSVSGSKDTSITSSVNSLDGSSTPVGSISSSATILNQEVERNKSVIGRNNNHWGVGAPRKFSAPGPSLTKQLSLCEPPGSSQDHHYYPFPQRKTPRKSEAARKLGMYASV